MSDNQVCPKLILSHLAALIVPAAYRAAQPPHDGTLPGLLAISRGTSIILLIVYAFYLWFQLRTHAELFQAPPSEEDAEPEKPKMNTAAACLA